MIIAVTTVATRVTATTGRVTIVHRRLARDRVTIVHRRMRDHTTTVRRRQARPR